MFPTDNGLTRYMASNSSKDPREQQPVQPSEMVPDPRQERSADMQHDDRPREIGGRNGPEPTRYGDWEKDGRCIDF